MIASIIITSYNRAHLLKHALKSLASQGMIGVEVIVLNDGDPNDETESVCESFMDKLELLRYYSTKRDFTQWRVPAYAINYGIKQSKGDMLFISCAEMFHMDNCVDAMIRVLEKSPKAMVITHGKDDDGSFLNKLNNNCVITDGDYNCLPPLINIRFPFFMGMMKSEIVKIGGYDEEYAGIGFDDNDIVHRLGCAGCHHIIAECRVVHLYHPRLTFNDPAVRMRLRNNEARFHAKCASRVIVRNQGKDWGTNF